MVVHLANAFARNLFAPESPAVLGQFATLLTLAANGLALPSGTVQALLAEAFQKAMELGVSIDLDRTCFALDEPAPKDTARHNLIQTCAELVESP